MSTERHRYVRIVATRHLTSRVPYVRLHRDECLRMRMKKRKMSFSPASVNSLTVATFSSEIAVEGRPSRITSWSKTRPRSDSACHRFTVQMSMRQVAVSFFAYTLDFRCPFLSILPSARNLDTALTRSITVNRVGHARVCSEKNKCTRIKISRVAGEELEEAEALFYSAVYRPISPAKIAALMLLLRRFGREKQHTKSDLALHVQIV
ncbi:hypothetical protein EVAR_32537_1 [Eumeta japonica]|uniref:Uncharacterized protein n=1 Tax=Eumeta variegata TaxID=151549 RepID=A0A4C1W6N6_EUMVA|nr:hypothetical protein EVAR_32537_1 [Eumeta japonica]